MSPKYGIPLTALAAILLAVAQNTKGSPPPPPTGPTTADAHLICQQFVTKRLKAPSTAKFPKLSDVKAFPEAGHMTVIGYVDSQNTFGAQVRTNYTCSVEPTTGDNWRLLSLDI